MRLMSSCAVGVKQHKFTDQVCVAVCAVWRQFHMTVDQTVESKSDWRLHDLAMSCTIHKSLRLAVQTNDTDKAR